jgi:hypothetical protein
VIDNLDKVVIGPKIQTIEWHSAFKIDALIYWFEAIVPSNAVSSFKWPEPAFFGSKKNQNQK